MAGALNFMAPIGTEVPGGGANPDYWTVEPALAISYLANNWVIAGNFFYDINGVSSGRMAGLTSAVGTMTPGQTFWGDITAVYKIGKWELGPVGAFEVQTSNDSGTGCAGANIRGCASITSADIGGLVGYDFGPVDLQVWATDRVAASNAPQGVGGINIFTRLGFRLWAPEAAKPLVAKN